jgi:hypothetical protein
VPAAAAEEKNMVRGVIYQGDGSGNLYAMVKKSFSRWVWYETKSTGEPIFTLDF